MTKDNVTGKNKDFYDLGKKIFDRLNPQGSITPEQPENEFNPDWDAMAVMVEEQQRMAKRIEELTQLVTSQGIRLYTTPPKKEWVGLTNEEIEDIRLEYHYADGAVKVGYERAIEAKLREKNG